MNLEKLRESIRVHEGLSLKPYTCPAGRLTIGFGKNLEEGITIQQAYQLLDADIATAMKELDRTQPGWRIHSEARQNVLIEMMFNLGANRLAGFRNMWSALRAQNYEQAAKDMIDSKWAAQVGNRAKTMAEQMRTGEFPK